MGEGGAWYSVARTDAAEPLRGAVVAARAVRVHVCRQRGAIAANDGVVDVDPRARVAASGALVVFDLDRRNAQALIVAVFIRTSHPDRERDGGMNEGGIDVSVAENLRLVDAPASRVGAGI